MILVSVILLLPFAAIKVLLLAVGIVAVFVKMKTGGNMDRGLYRIGHGRPHTYWEAAIRNPVGGMGWWFKHPTGGVKTYGDIEEPTANGPRFQARFKRYKWMCSFRVVWRYSRTRYGELYVGWKLDSAPPELDFALSPRVWAKVGN